MRKKILVVFNTLLLGLLVSYITSHKVFAMPIHKIDPTSVRMGTDSRGNPMVYANLIFSHNQSMENACGYARYTIYGGNGGNVIYDPNGQKCYTYPTGRGSRWLNYEIYPVNQTAGNISLYQVAKDFIDSDVTYGYLNPLTDKLNSLGTVNVRFELIEDIKNNPQNFEMCLMWYMSKVGQSLSTAAKSITERCQNLGDILVPNSCQFDNINFNFPDALANSVITGMTLNMNYRCARPNTPIKLSWIDSPYYCNGTGININNGTANTCVEVKANNNIIRQPNAPISMTLQNQTGYIPFSAAIQNQLIASPGTYRGSRQLLISYD